MKYSLIQVDREYDGMVDGVWLQNHTGTIDSAAEVARETERANSNRITVAVVEDLGYSEPNFSLRTALKRLDIAQNLIINCDSKNIQFIEKEPWQNRDIYTGYCDMYPNFMVKDGVEHFMFNRRSDQTKYDAELNEARKKQLLDNDGKYFKFYGYTESPHEYLRFAIEGRNSFDNFGHKEVEWVKDGNFYDFHGNLREVSAAFHYRIYDKNMAVNIEKIVDLIHQKKYNEALLALNECNKGQFYERSEEAVTLGDKIKAAQSKLVESAVVDAPEREER